MEKVKTDRETEIACNDLSIESIKKLIDENYNTYKSSSRITSDYRGEKGLTEAYNGRQLLEMLQNADDAQTDKVLLHLDTENKILTIANNGITFDIKGLGSLMLANNSPKNKRDFIGNKGLGFRSILNWVEVVKIKTKECILEFSKEIARKQFEQLIPDSTTRQQIIENEKDLPKGDVPFAVLAIPDFKKNTEFQDWETIVELKYKKEEVGKILEQLKTITPEVLLFLNHTTSIKISGAGEIDKELVLTPSRDEIEKTLTVNDITWNLFDSREQNLPYNTEKFYKYKIAWQNDLSDTETRFATYFPTQVATHLPYLIHATFDLDPSRNHLNKSDDNEYILNQIATTLKKIASIEIVNKDKPDWKALDFLTMDGKSENPHLANFFQSVENAKSELAIYPTVDGRYRTICEVKHYGNEFSEWVLYNKLETYFPDLLLPIPQNRIVLVSKISSKYTLDGWKSIFEKVTHEIVSIDERVNLIKLLVKDNFKELHGRYYPLLIDNADKATPSDIQVFTLERGSVKNYLIPEFSKMTFISNQLLEKLIIGFSDEINANRIKEEHKTRPLKRILDPVLNIGSNDILDVAKNLISSSNSYIEDNQSLLKIEKVINETLTSLFKIFCENENREGILRVPIKLLNRQNEIVKCNDLFLGAEYPIGSITEKLFENIYSESLYLNSNYLTLLEDDSVNITTIENFFFWLGVNKYLKLKTIDAPKEQNLDHTYIEYVYDKMNKKDHPKSGYSYKGLAIDDFENTVAKLSSENLIVLIIKEIKIKQRLDFANADDQLKYSYIHWFDIYPKPSYIYYQISKHFNFENYLIDNSNLNYINNIYLDTLSPIFFENKITLQEINQVLILLGAKTSFSQLNPNRIYQILHDIEKLDNDGKTTQNLYRLALNSFEKKDYNPLPEQLKGLRVFAKTGDNKNFKWEFADKVHYSNNTVLPSGIIKDQLILNVPKRFGEDKVKKYLGVRLFSDFELEIIEDTVSINKSLTFELMKELENLQPYILSYRLKDIFNEKIQKEAAKTLKGLSVKLIISGSYRTKQNPEIKLQLNEFIRQDNIFYLCIERELSLTSLKTNSKFCDAISEILCLIFKVWDNREQFRIAFKYGINELQHLFESTGEDQCLEVARELLGLSSYEIKFWSIIAIINRKEWPETIPSMGKLQEELLVKFNYSLPDYYSVVNFETFNNHQSFYFIKDICHSQDLALTEIKTHLDNFPGLKHYHLEKFRQIALDIEIIWNKAWWLDLSVKPKEEQTKFEDKRNLYLEKRYEIIKKLAEQFTWDIEVDYENAFLNQLTSEFNIVFQKENLIAINLEYKYQKLIKKYNINTEELSPTLKSLLFFEGHKEVLNSQFVEFNKQEIETDESANTEEGETVAANAVITSIGIGTAPANKANDGLGNKKGGTHSEKRELQNKKAGKRAEKLVRDKLIELYPDGEIRWISGNSEDNSLKLDDSKGFDISYKKNKTDEHWKYLEVKSSSSGHSFIISANEVTVGIENKQNYHLALVNGSNINFVEDFFLNEIRLAEFNVLRNSASIRPLDYEVFYNIPKTNSKSEVKIEDVINDCDKEIVQEVE